MTVLAKAFMGSGDSDTSAWINLASPEDELVIGLRKIGELISSAG